MERREEESIAYLKEGYSLVWADEFNTNGRPDPANWKFEHGFLRNEEQQWYQADNAWCEDGKLIIEGREESKPNPFFKVGAADWRKKSEKIRYSSSSINSSGLRSWQYGRFVMRGKIDVSLGLWPAWWTLGIAGNWPSNGEIDIMEFYKGKLLANVARGTKVPYRADWHSETRSIAALGGKDWASKFHVWRMDWTAAFIELYVDDQLLLKVDVDQLYNKDESGINPFRQAHYMVLNLALGGINGGSLADTKFPNRFEVDYVRVYQK
jgi:beta-glucanase (GH16 family)